MGLNMIIERRKHLPMGVQDSGDQQTGRQQRLGEHHNRDQPAFDRIVGCASARHVYPIQSILQYVTLAAKRVN